MTSAIIWMMAGGVAAFIGPHLYKFLKGEEWSTRIGFAFGIVVLAAMLYAAT